MVFGLIGDNVVEVVVRQDVRELQQWSRHIVGIVRKLHHDVAGGPLERRQQLGHVGPRLHLDQLGELAKDLVILCDLLIVTAIRDIGEELRHVAEQLVALDYIRVPIEDPEGRKGARAFFQF